MIRVLLDQGMPRGAAELLTRARWDALHVSECGLAAAADTEILLKAVEQGRFVCTMDADFHTLLALSGASGPSAIRVRIEGLKAAGMAELLLSVWPRIEAAINRGAVISITPRLLRLRHLPIGGR